MYMRRVRLRRRRRRPFPYSLLFLSFLSLSVRVFLGEGGRSRLDVRFKSFVGDFFLDRWFEKRVASESYS